LWFAVQKEIRSVVKGFKYVPKDLRDKKTRAIRRRLTVSEVCVAVPVVIVMIVPPQLTQLVVVSFQKAKKTVKAAKKAANLPLRRFAVKA
jgi:hypothetical protein